VNEVAASLLFDQHPWNEASLSLAGVDEAGVGAWAGPVIAARPLSAP
jgi:hypothetical protein